ncbi:MAG: hypothetical protein HYR84_00630 [Planctomycetes bacterium]|nr:hypothetical protein [Planctomycetota bacterium]
MNNIVVIWDDEDDPDGNYWHICVEGHGLTRGKSKKSCATTEVISK